MGERTEARRSIEASRARMSVIADELARRTSPDYVKGRAREAAMIRASNVRDRAASNPGALAALGAALGGGASFALSRLAKKRRGTTGYYEGGGFRTEGTWVSRDYVERPAWRADEVGRATWSNEPGYTPRYGAEYSASPEVSTVGAESWSEPYPSTPSYGTEGYRSPEAERSWESTRDFEGGPSRGEQLKSKASDLKAKAGDLGHRMTDKKDELQHRMSGKKDELRHRRSDKKAELRHKMQERRESGGPGLRERMPSPDEMRTQARRHPGPVILGGVLLGSLAAALLPLSRRERKVMHPAKEKARTQLGDQFSHLEQRFEEKLGFQEEGEETPRRSDAQDFSRGENRQGRSDDWSERESGSFASTSTTPGSTFSSGTPSGGTYATTTSTPPERSSREDLGLRENQGSEPYRQPSVGEQLEKQDKDKGGGTFH